MTITRRGLGGAAAAMLAAPALGQGGYPTRPVRVIVPSAPGDGGDSIARLFAHHYERLLGQGFIVENRTGAGGRIGTEAAVRAPADGYTLVMGNAGSHGINAALYRTLPYDIARDFAPISLLVEAPNVLVVNRAKLPVRDVAALIALAKEKPGTHDYASGGPGTSAHLTMELFKSLAGVDLQHVPFRGAGPALQALVSGEPPVMFVNLPPAMAFIRRGELYALAVTSAERTPDLPDVPTVAENGLPGFETIAWFGLLAPAGTPRPVIERLHAASVEIAAMPDVVEKVRLIGGFPRASTPEQFRARIESDIAKWRRLVAERNLAQE
jgi:tripartite-type tricarboxylate transporter receptor subunit TctC